MACFFQKSPKLRLESDLNKPDALIDLACRDALQDVLQMLKRCPSGELLRVEFNASYKGNLKTLTAPKALACAFMELKQNKAYVSVLQDVKTSYDLCYPHMKLAAFFLVSAAGSAYVGTLVFGMIAMLAVCLALFHVCGYEVARVARETQPSLLDEKLAEIEQALKVAYPGVEDVVQKKKVLDSIPLYDDENACGGENSLDSIEI
jgi:hypothetical protein